MKSINFQNFKNKLINSLKNDSLKESFELFFETLSSSNNYYSELVLKNADYKRIEKAYRENVIDWETMSRNKNKIIKAVLELLSELEKEINLSKQVEIKSSSKREVDLLTLSINKESDFKPNTKEDKENIKLSFIDPEQIESKNKLSQLEFEELKSDQNPGDSLAEEILNEFTAQRKKNISKKDRELLKQLISEKFNSELKGKNIQLEVSKIEIKGKGSIKLSGGSSRINLSDPSKYIMSTNTTSLSFNELEKYRQKILNRILEESELKFLINKRHELLESNDDEKYRKELKEITARIEKINSLEPSWDMPLAKNNLLKVENPNNSNLDKAFNDLASEFIHRVR